MQTMSRYIRFGPTFNAKKHELIPANQDIYELISKRGPTKDWYISLYRYSDHHFKHFEKEKSVAGIRDVTTNRLFFDFDSEINIEQAQKDATSVCERLMALGIPEDKIRIYYSGGKGFHVEVISKQELTRNEFVNIVNDIAGDLQTFDTKVKDEARILRAPLTRHPKTGLYKIPLSFSDIKDQSLKTIQEWAKDENALELADALKDELFEIDLPERITRLKDKAPETPASTLNTPIKGFDITDIDFSKAPKWLSKERYALQEGFFYGRESVDKGERNAAFMILAATYRAQGFSSDHALSLLKATAKKQAARTGEPEYTEEQLRREVIAAVYSPHWKGGIYGKDEELLILTRKRFNLDDPIEDEESDIVDITNVGLDFQRFAENIDQNRVLTGLKSLDDEIIITSGMMIALLASPGAGKTTFANLFTETLNKHGENSLYFSLDMYKNLLFSRLLQKYSGYDIRKIFEMFKTKSPDETLLNAYADVLENYSKVSFNFRSGITVDEMEDEIKKYQDRIGKTPKLIVVDYLEKIRTQFTDTTASTSYAAGRLSDISKKFDTTVLLLVQPSKMNGDPRDEFRNYRAIKGSSSIEQEARLILGLHRPGYNPKDSSDDRYVTVSVLKNNVGGLCSIDFGWDGVSGRIYELSDYERFELKKLRQRLEAEKEQTNGKYDL